MRGVWKRKASASAAVAVGSIECPGRGVQTFCCRYTPISIPAKHIAKYINIFSPQGNQRIKRMYTIILRDIFLISRSVLVVKGKGLTG